MLPSFSCTKSLSINDVSGQYVNTNYHYEPFIVDIPYEADTLTLYENGTYSSSYWGEGDFKITSSGSAHYLTIFYQFELGLGSYKARLNDMGEGDYRIILDHDRGHYYRKIN